VKVDDMISNKIKLKGIPQGGVISPVMFLVFIDDITYSIPTSVGNSLHADDLAGWSTQDENPIRNLIRILSKILSRILVRFLLKILNRKMPSESDQNPIGNLIRNLARILVRFLLKILNRKMAS
jgi:hypothetical protein